MIIATIYGEAAIRNIGISSSEQMLLHLCETIQKNLDSYLEDVEQEVETASGSVGMSLLSYFLTVITGTGMSFSGCLMKDALKSVSGRQMTGRRWI
jgi:hypothetical protein